MIVDFLRHGETERAGDMLGRTDPSLSSNGHTAMASQLGAHRWPLIVSSPLLRARETAEIAARESAVRIEIDPGWREIDFGDWDGRPRTALADDPALAAFYADPEANTPPNGERLTDVRHRVTGALERLLAHTDSPALVVAHGGSIRVALAVLLAIPFERLWAFRIVCGTRMRVALGHHDTRGLWGEIIEIVQPADEQAR